MSAFGEAVHVLNVSVIEVVIGGDRRRLSIGDYSPTAALTARNIADKDSIDQIQRRTICKIECACVSTTARSFIISEGVIQDREVARLNVQAAAAGRLFAAVVADQAVGQRQIAAVVVEATAQRGATVPHVQRVERERRTRVVEVAAHVLVRRTTAVTGGVALGQRQPLQRHVAARDVERTARRRLQNRGMRQVIGRIGVPIRGRVAAVDGHVLVDVSHLRDDVRANGPGDGIGVGAGRHADLFAVLRLAQRVLQGTARPSGLRLRAVVVGHVDGVRLITRGLVDQGILPVRRDVAHAGDGLDQRVVGAGMHHDLLIIVIR